MEKRQEILLLVNNIYVHRNFKKDGRYVFRVEIPEGTRLHGKDISGYAFYPAYEKRFGKGKNSKDKVVFVFLDGSTVELVKGVEKSRIEVRQLKEIYDEEKNHEK
ncbi:hypothetical protein M2140_001782 [Clostridiales Family XIII bacterium PM5-7]